MEISEPIAPGTHRLSGYILKLMSARIPVMLVGPAGTGKSRVVRDVAEHLYGPGKYGETPMTAGATPSWLIGREGFATGNGNLPEIPEDPTMADLLRALHALRQTTSYKISHLLKIYTGGGVFLFDEIDASDPNMSLVANNLLALQPGETFFNPVNGEEYVRHEDFRPVAAGNTFGLGASAAYTGRERLDLATIDRFRMGRVYWPLDEDLARSLILGK